jgi:malate dehydrogenase (oxaloacetate-decarboxylating)
VSQPSSPSGPVARARRVADAMFVIAGRTLADLSPAKTDEDSRLLPPVDQLRVVASAVAFAVARQAQAEGVVDPSSDDELRARIREHIWEPSYRTYRKLV